MILVLGQVRRSKKEGHTCVTSLIVFDIEMLLVVIIPRTVLLRIQDFDVSLRRILYLWRSLGKGGGGDCVNGGISSKKIYAYFYLYMKIQNDVYFVRLYSRYERLSSFFLNNIIHPLLYKLYYILDLERITALRKEISYGGQQIPSSVMIPVTYFDGVMSNAGLQT